MCRSASLFAFSVMLVLMGCSHSNPSSLLDVRYGDGERNTLDIYLPPNAELAPVVIFVHGGRWYRNDKSQIELYDRITALNDAGLAVVSINYTYSSEDIWPAQINDTLAAIEFVQDNADTYGYDGQKIGLWGQSSGAHLALMATMTLDESQVSPVDALVSWYGPTDLFKIRQDRMDDDVPGENERFKEPSPESLLLGLPIDEAKNEADAASPFVLAQSLPTGVALPPILMVHGESDSVISPLQTQRLYRLLKDRAIAPEITMSIVPGGGHGGDGFEAQVSPAVQHFSKYLRDSASD